MLCGKHAKQGAVRDDDIYVAMNMYWEALPFSLPPLPSGRRWHVFANTSASAPQDIYPPGQEVPIEDPASILAGGRSVIILVGR
jgi:isoamylase